MPQCVVIADDLTGANATGVLLKKMNYKAYTVMNTERIELSTLSDCDCVLYPTDSRGVDAKIAYNRVYIVCNLLKDDDVKVYANRIDSTLRGNLGSETDAMLDSLGEDYIAIVAPCFPASGRIICGGYMLVDGLPLHKTNIAVDPKCQGKGYGKALIDFLANNYADEYSVLQVGTGDSPLTIPFYERCGFVRSHNVPNFFPDNYDHPIYEGDVQLIDMVYLQRHI